MVIRPNLHILITLLALVNPLEGIPLFLAKTGTESAEARNRIAFRAATAVTIILLVSAIVGAHVLTLFGVSLPAFQAGGGVILLLIAVQMTLVGVNTGKSPSAEDPGSAHEDIAIVPLAIPLLAGPGAISGSVLFGTRTKSLVDLVILSAVIVIVGAITMSSLIAANRLRRKLGDNGINIATRLMGLLIAGMATELIVDGVLQIVRR